MIISYKKLWKLLVDKDMKKKDLMEKAHINSTTISKLNRGSNVSAVTLIKICHALDCSFVDIMEIVPEYPATHSEMGEKAQQ